TIVEKNVDCAACHADLVHGSGGVSRRDCQNCHDQQRYLKDYDDRTTEIIRDYHQIHAAGQHARCNDCHLLIQHNLTPVIETSDMSSLLKPVQQDCQHCHPDHHREQIELLLGQGGLIADVSDTPNQMMGSRVNCRGCHIEGGADDKGDAVIISTAESCRGCHSQEYQELFVRWQRTIEARLTESHKLLAAVQQRLTSLTTQPDRDLTEANRLAERARHNINLVYTANGIHNKNYALVLLDQAVADLEKVMGMLPR
ncbi:MAG: cytochrome c3 family protein, partial [Planctomycetota bacterium]